MTKVAPAGEEEDENDNPRNRHHHHTPNTRHYKDATTDHHNRNALVNFEQYTAQESVQDDDEVPPISGRNTDRSRGRGDAAQRQSYSRGGPPPIGARPPARAASRATVQKQTANAGKFMQWDTLAFVIILAYILCFIVAFLAIWCYRQDTAWNSIVRSERSFPDIANENFFSGKHLYIYDTDEGLRHAKKHLLRENRWLELMHLMFMCAFLILTLFQLAAYVTRGDEDHSRLIICYYTIFGGLGLIVALFPLLSWHNQENNYKVAVHYLHDFHRRVTEADPINYAPGLTLATAQDARTLGNIMKFCYDVSQDGLTIEEDVRYFELMKRYYRLPQLQHLGFCTHHKFKIANTIVSTMFALICCAVPCIYCFLIGEEEKMLERTWNNRAVQQQMYARQQQPPPPPYQYTEGGEMEGREMEGRPRKPRRHRGEQTSLEGLTEREMREIEKWKKYINAEDEEDQQ